MLIVDPYWLWDLPPFGKASLGKERKPASSAAFHELLGKKNTTVL